MVENLDRNIGRVLAALERAGQAQNTVVVFTSDNGGLATAEGSPTCNAPLAEGKGWMYEGGTRTPLVIRWPAQIAPGWTSATPVTSTDFYPTFLEAAGLDPMPWQHCDGQSLLPLLTGRGALARDAIFWHYPHYGNQGGTPGSSIRCGDYKLLEFYENRGAYELYDLRADLSEEHDIAQDDPARTRELAQRLTEWRASVQAKTPEVNPAWLP
jgi:arylsulfatase A-like enzyme